MFGIIKEFEHVLACVPALFHSVNLPIHISAKACQAWRCYLFQLKLRFSASLCCLSGSAKTSPPLSPSFSPSQYGTNCMSYCCIFLYRASNVLMCVSQSSSIMNNSSFAEVSWGLCDSKNGESLWALLTCSSLQHETEISPAVHLLSCVSTIPCYLNYHHTIGTPWLFIFNPQPIIKKNYTLCV